MTQALYLYGIAGAGRLPLSQVYGVEGGVSVLEHGGLGAIVGAPPQGGLHELSREKAVRLLLGHQQVLEAAMNGATVLPVKFGTVSPSEAAVRSLMRQKRDMLTGLLAEFSGCLQMEIVVLWQAEAVFGEIAAEPAIMEARREAQNGGKEAAVKLGQAVKAALERRRAAMQARIGESLRPAVMDIAFNAPMDDRMAANLAVLIGPADGGRLEAALEHLDAEFGGRLTLRCVGPLPPASFATLQVTFPSAQAIARARQALGITGPLNQKDIASAFRNLAREHHPDLAAAGNQSNERMDELTRAYRLLLACAKSQRGSPAGEDQDEPVLLEVAGQRDAAPLQQQRGAA
jgi:Gas vesicle synthesis protein GvpL/GvpF/DnaJ domain